jgi:hypothetical protein
MCNFQAEHIRPIPDMPSGAVEARGQVARDASDGGRWVVFEYCVSCLIMTVRRPSREFFLRNGDRAWLRGLPYSAISLLFGWWGVPWGPILTPVTVYGNLTGGRPARMEGAATPSAPP